MLFHIHTEAVFRQISDMAHGCDNVIAFSQIFLEWFSALAGDSTITNFDIQLPPYYKLLLKRVTSS